jgi:hypothetical protein
MFVWSESTIKVVDQEPAHIKPKAVFRALVWLSAVQVF